jgi:energy-coupling factor transport system substrate-specific component
MAAVSPRLLALIPLGTVLVAAVAGPAAALLTGIVSQTTFTVLDGRLMWLAFLPVQLGVALYASWAAWRGLFANVPRALLSGAGLGVLAATLSWPISLLLFGGVTAGGVTIVTTLLTALGVPLTWAVYAASLSSDVLDKLTTFLLVHAVLISLPARMAARFPAAARALGRA